MKFHVRARARRLFFGCSLLLLASLLAPTPHAQVLPPEGDFGRITGTESLGTSYYYFTEPGAPTVRVELWGDVGTSGLYDLQAGTDLRTLLTIASGPTFLSSPSIRQRVEVTIVRGAQGERETLDVIDVMDAARNQNPVLENGDTVIVRSITKTAFTYREIISTAVVVIGLILSIQRLTE